MNYDMDLKGLSCPFPILKAQKQIKLMNRGELLTIHVTDLNTIDDLKILSESGVISIMGHTINTKKATITIRKEAA